MDSGGSWMPHSLNAKYKRERRGYLLSGVPFRSPSRKDTLYTSKMVDLVVVLFYLCYAPGHFATGGRAV
jgi:hypothetical protein